MLLNKRFLIKTFLILVLVLFPAWNFLLVWSLARFSLECMKRVNNMNGFGLSGILDVFFTLNFSLSTRFGELSERIGADSVFSNPCHGFCNQRKKSIFRCHGWMCLTLAQSRSIHHRNTLKGGQTLNPASGPDVNYFCGQPNCKHFIFIYSVLAYKITFCLTIFDYPEAIHILLKLKDWKKRVHVLFSSVCQSLLTLLSPAQDMCVGFIPDETIWRFSLSHTHTHTWRYFITSGIKMMQP